MSNTQTKETNETVTTTAKYQAGTFDQASYDKWLATHNKLMAKVGVTELSINALFSVIKSCKAEIVNKANRYALNNKEFIESVLISDEADKQIKQTQNNKIRAKMEQKATTNEQVRVGTTA